MCACVRTKIGKKWEEMDRNTSSRIKDNGMDSIRGRGNLSLLTKY